MDVSAPAAKMLVELSKSQVSRGAADCPHAAQYEQGGDWVELQASESGVGIMTHEPRSPRRSMRMAGFE
jgi:hypothetical protein